MIAYPFNDRRTLFYKTIKHLNIPTQRNSSLTNQQKKQLVLNEIEADLNGQNGANHIKHELARKGYRGIPQYFFYHGIIYLHYSYLYQTAVP